MYFNFIYQTNYFGTPLNFIPFAIKNALNVFLTLLIKLLYFLFLFLVGFLKFHAIMFVMPIAQVSFFIFKYVILA